MHRDTKNYNSGHNSKDLSVSTAANRASQSIEHHATTQDTRKEGIVFLVWAPSSPRAEGLSKSLDAKLFLLSYKFKKKFYAPVKYPILFVKSVSILIRTRPGAVICQEPSPLCTLAAMTYRLLAKNKPAIIVDAHTAAFDPPWAYLRSLHKIILKKADAVIVTNAGLEHRLRTEYEVERCFVLPDKIPDLQSHLSGMRSRVPMVEDNSFRVAVICSFAPDEPVREILAAAKLRRNVTFYITGNFSAAMSSEEIAQITDELANVIFTGYLDKTDYVSLLSDVNAVIVLTKRQDTMLSGAYEALSLAKPLITSSHPALLQYFSSGTIHANNTPEDIARALDKVIEQENRLSKESFELRNKRQIEWWRQFNHVVGFLGLMPPTYIVQSEGKAAEGADSAKRTDTEAI